MSPKWKFVLVTSLVVAASLSPAARGAELFQYVAVAKSARIPPTIQNPVAVRLDFPALVAAGAGASFDAALPNGKTVTIRIESTERHANGDISWSGHVLDVARQDLAARGTTGSAGTFAEIETRDGTWGVVPAGAEHDWLFDETAAQMRLPRPSSVDDARVPPAQMLEARPKTTCPTGTGMPAPQVTIDVLAVITPDFVSTQGGAAAAETRLNDIFSNMNAYNAASNVAITYRRVGTMQVDYQAASTPGDDDGAALTAITNGSGNFVNVAAIRSFFGADLVALFRGPKNTSGTSISGVAWVNGDANGNIPSSAAGYMYSVNGDWTFPGATLAAHELGHNLGNNHDRPNAPTTPSGSTSYAYGYYVCGANASATCGQAGFNDTGTGFGTIMAYQQPTVAKFASPGLTCQSTRSGALAAPCGVANQEDDVRSMNCVRQTVAAVKSSWVGNCPNLASDADADGIPDCIEAGSGTVNGTKDNDVFGKALLFSAQQYRDFLSRESDADGLNFWTGALNAGTQTRAQMIEGFVNSAEFQAQLAPVARLYFAYFLRVPDYAGLQYWIGQFKGGVALSAISQNFATSQEFVNRYGSLDNTQFVTLVYNNVLGRAPDAAGLTYYVGQLASGTMDRGAVMLSFSESTEYKGLINNKVYVTMVYSGMLRRAPDDAGFNYWVGYLGGGNSGQALIGGFLASQEYHNRFLP